MANEKRLIDANAFWESVSTDYWEHFTQCHTTDQIDLMEMVEENLAEQPTVDAVEVVRCKDCKHWHEETGWCNQHSHFIGEKGEACHPWESNDWKMLNEDDFCSYGERKDNEN